MTFTRTIPPELVASVEKYILLPQNSDWRYDAERQANLPVAKWATVEDYLGWAFGQILAGPLATCPPEAYTAEVAVLEEMKAAAMQRYMPAKEQR